MNESLSFALMVMQAFVVSGIVLICFILPLVIFYLKDMWKNSK